MTAHAHQTRREAGETHAAAQKGENEGMTAGVILHGGQNFLQGGQKNLHGVRINLQSLRINLHGLRINLQGGHKKTDGVRISPHAVRMKAERDGPRAGTVRTGTFTS